MEIFNHLFALSSILLTEFGTQINSAERIDTRLLFFLTEYFILLGIFFVIYY